MVKRLRAWMIALRDLARYVDAEKARAALAPEWEKRFKNAQR